MDPENLLRAIDAVVRHRALVYGSLPPEGRDLDLLVLPDDATTIAARLRDEGFRKSDRGWVAFDGSSASLVDLCPASTLRVHPAELDALFAEASPLAELTRVVEPAPHHTLLILSRRLAHEPRLLPKHRARIERAVARDPAAWERARSRATLWASESALERLQSLHADPGRRFHWRQLGRRPRRTRVIALAGVDANRTRSQAEVLSRTLDQLGFDPSVERPHPPKIRPRSAVGSRRASRIREPALAVASALSLWRPVWRRLGRGRILIYERSALDFAVAVAGEDMTGAKRMLAVRLLGILSPTPLRSYLLDVADPDGDGLGRRAEAYRAASTLFAARPLSPDRSPGQVSEEIAVDVWWALTRRTALASALRNVLAPVRRRRGPRRAEARTGWR